MGSVGSGLATAPVSTSRQIDARALVVTRPFVAMLDFLVAQEPAVARVTFASVSVNSVTTFAVDTGAVAAIILVELTSVSGESSRTFADVRAVRGIPTSSTVQTWVVVITLVLVNLAVAPLVSKDASASVTVDVISANTAILARARSTFVDVNLATISRKTCKKICRVLFYA